MRTVVVRPERGLLRVVGASADCESLIGTRWARGALVGWLCRPGDRLVEPWPEDPDGAV